MNRIIPILMVIVVGAVSQAGFDYTISDTYHGGFLPVEGTKSLLVKGAGAYDIAMQDESYIEVQNTAPLQYYKGGIYTLSLADYSTMNYYNGQMGGFDIWGDATATFSGGRIDYIFSHQNSNLQQHITFICDVDSVNLTGNVLTGDWLGDKGSFSVTLENQAGYDSVYSNIQFIPEPATLVLFSLGGLLLRRRKM